MKINHAYNITNEAMNIIENIDMMDPSKRKYNQEKINKAYELLDHFRDELIRENIKNKQKEVQKI